MKKLFSGGIMLIFSLSVVSSFAQSEWALKKNVDGFRVYYGESPNSRIKELKMDFEVQASLNTIMAVLNDAESFKRWIYKLKELKVIDRPSARELTYYYEMDFPWPLYNRDGVAETSYFQDPETKIIYTRNNARPRLAPEKKGVIRLQLSDVKWKITPIGKERTHIEYYLLSDPGGNLPAWMINWALDRGPVKSMKAFQEMLTEEKYRQQKLSWIKDF
jgi:hypothetical protein